MFLCLGNSKGDKYAIVSNIPVCSTSTVGLLLRCTLLRLEDYSARDIGSFIMSYYHCLWPDVKHRDGPSRFYLCGSYHRCWSPWCGPQCSALVVTSALGVNGYSNLEVVFKWSRRTMLQGCNSCQGPWCSLLSFIFLFLQGTSLPVLLELLNAAQALSAVLASHVA